MANQNPYQSPHPESLAREEKGQESRNDRTHYSPQYNAAFRTALLIQSALAILTLLILDFGQMHRAFWVAFLCQWAMVWVILFRRPMNPTRFDLFVVRYGIVPMLFLVGGAGTWCLRLLGVQF
ncbi:hypothetical protein VN12_17910 [Pirellula sp. SH-Sr6A]|uniref:hypothetical protein n=1 Tax=Pirellula sp. SH-Sr6A TaxID=1632865 RepID=UPI00078E3ED3|nr:hypothetical protein [Pirellula sp. SH-Sr6A]AMV34010.1 hypothetical protein VN12_17910 [Pirellula sp. SH-Sr6A]